MKDLIMRAIPAVMPMTLPVTMVNHAMIQASMPKYIKKTIAINRTPIPPMKMEPRNLLLGVFSILAWTRSDANKVFPKGAGVGPQMFI